MISAELDAGGVLAKAIAKLEPTGTIPLGWCYRFSRAPLERAARLGRQRAERHAVKRHHLEVLGPRHARPAGSGRRSTAIRVVAADPITTRRANFFGCFFFGLPFFAFAQSATDDARAAEACGLALIAGVANARAPCAAAATTATKRPRRVIAGARVSDLGAATWPRV